jgi:uncharacterized protein YjbJ (UPF0337 family)
MGKMMEKVGQMTNNEGLVEKGRARRASQGYKAEETVQTAT